jgi:hypothetical protein
VSIIEREAEAVEAPTQPPVEDAAQAPDPAPERPCAECGAPLQPDQDWCLECGAPARTRLAPTPNWQLPTVAIGAIVLVAGALLAFAFVKLTSDDNAAPAGTTPSAVVETGAPTANVPPTATTPAPAAIATTTGPAGPAVPSTVPGQTTTAAPTTTVPPQGTATSQGPITATTSSGDVVTVGQP